MTREDFAPLYLLAVPVTVISRERRDRDVVVGTKRIGRMRTLVVRIVLPGRMIGKRRVRSGVGMVDGK